ncbi:hypothetical protein CBER1_05768 [Cercospora berteroae]|uniref:Uncharacterized protein n=1 Tax=Cercospora berteroae TaxID=357750 RepID=A0A2S6CHY1_9PEZI|nr:hypothetical protein CBER1_05768 [Cercospora berteroae]
MASSKQFEYRHDNQSGLEKQLQRFEARFEELFPDTMAELAEEKKRRRAERAALNQGNPNATSAEDERAPEDRRNKLNKLRQEFAKLWEEVLPEIKVKMAEKRRNKADFVSSEENSRS